jgi:hypothetical protein
MKKSKAPLAHSISKVHEVAPWGRSTTFRLVAEGKLPARKLGRSTYVLHADLEAFLAGLDSVVTP